MRRSTLAAAIAVGLALGQWAIVGPAAGQEGLYSEWEQGYKARARLVAGRIPGEGNTPTLIAGVEIAMLPGWKTYWKSPGDAGGVPPQFDWSKSENVADAKVLYPAPKRLSDSAGDAIGYKEHVIFPVEITAKDAKKPVMLRLALEYGMCKEICVPVEAELGLEIAPSGADRPSQALALARDHVPRPQQQRRATDPAFERHTVALAGEKPRISIEARFPDEIAGADVFLSGPDTLYLPVTKKVSEAEGGRIVFEVDLSSGLDVEELKGQTITATLVSEAGQSEATFKVE